MSTPTLYIEGPAFWTPTLHGWEAEPAQVPGEVPLAEEPAHPPYRPLEGPAPRPRAARHRIGGRMVADD